jgi:hypothetical protein
MKSIWLKISRVPPLMVGQLVQVIVLSVLLLVSRQGFGVEWSVLLVSWVLALGMGSALEYLFPAPFEHHTRSWWVIWATGWTLLGLGSGVRVWGSGYLSTLFLENTATMAAHGDTLFHISIAQMIAHFGVVSTGVVGLVSLPYHAGSHALFALLHRITGIEMYLIYNWVYPLVVLPLLFTTAVRLSVRWSSDLTSAAPWILLCLWWGVVPYILMAPLGLTPLIFISESESVGLLISGVLLLFLDKKITTHSPSLLWLMLIGIVLLSVGWIKISLLYLWLGGVGIALYSFPLENKRLWWSWYMWLGITAAVLAIQLSLPEHHGTWQLLAYWRSYIPLAWWPVWLGAGLVGGWIVLVLMPKWRTPLAFFTLWTVAPLTILNLPGATAGYFLDGWRWAMCLLVLTLIPQKTTWNLAWRALLVVSILLTCLNLAHDGWWWSHQAIERRARFQELYGSTRLNTAITNQDLAVTLLWLLEIDQHQPPDSHLYLPPTSVFWQLSSHCSITPLIAPALAGLPLKNSLPSTCQYSGFGYQYQLEYQQFKIAPQASPLSPPK